MDWNPAYSWLVLALLLSLAELTSGAMVLLALGIAAAPSQKAGSDVLYINSSFVCQTMNLSRGSRTNRGASCFTPKNRLHAAFGN